MGLDSINPFFEEGRKLWNTDMDLVISKRFYELWENVEKPKPFPIKGSEIELFSQPFELSGEYEDRIGYFSWDVEEMCPALFVECDECVDKFLLTFDDGNPRVYETEPEFFEVEVMGDGERFEVIYDVISYVTQNRPELDILALSKKHYLEVLDSIKHRHDTFAINNMKKSSAYHVKNMIKEAVQDMALDELSSQLSLPLGGGYGVGSSIDDNNLDVEERISRRTFKSRIPKRTKWTILLEMELLSVAGCSAFELEKELIIRFSNVKVLRSNGKGTFSIQLRISETLPLREGEKMVLFVRGTKEPIGELIVDVYDGEIICGRVNADIDSLDNRVYARPRNSPREFLTVAFGELMRVVDKSEAEGLSPALNAVLGLTEAQHISKISDIAPERMDFSQNRAWTTAVDATNPVVLIQGPPGTGKTTVLEEVLRTLIGQGKRVLVTAPSNTAVDNICRRCFDLPILRIGRQKESIAPDVADTCWIGEKRNITKFTLNREKFAGASIYASTHVGVIKDRLIREEISQNGVFDVIVFDEAGMSRTDEFLLCVQLSKRAILFGDQQQLPPFPLPKEALDEVNQLQGPLPKHLLALLNKSALEWLVTERKFPIVMMEKSYRCQNPRLLRFSSTLFYNAQVKASEYAEYYQLSYVERHKRYPASTLRLFKTSELPLEMRSEQLTYEGNKPGIDNPLEAEICVNLLYECLKRYPLDEITIIAPYRRQIRLIRDKISKAHIDDIVGTTISDLNWQRFLFTRIATVDSFQGGESDVVIICYVRSNDGKGIGFVDDANRINVAHTRARREMAIVGDIECLKSQARNNIFQRMERACERDGELITLDITNPIISGESLLFV